MESTEAAEKAGAPAGKPFSDCSYGRSLLVRRRIHHAQGYRPFKAHAYAGNTM